MGLTRERNYDASWIDHVLNPTIGLPWQLVMRSVRAFQEEDVDLFSREGLADPALIPFVGGFYSQSKAVGIQETAQRVAKPLGFDPDDWRVQMGSAILTDPLTYATLGISAAGRLAAGAKSTRTLLAKAGQIIPSGGTVGDFLAASRGGLEGANKSLGAWKRGTLAKSVSTMEDIVAKNPEFAKRTMASLTEDAAREVAAIGIPLPYLSRVQIKMPGMGQGWRNVLLRPVRTAASLPLIGASKTLDGVGTLVGGTAKLFGAGVSGQRGAASLFKGVADGLMLPVDFGRGLIARAEDRIHLVSGMNVLMHQLVDSPETVSRLSQMRDPAEMVALILEKTDASPRFAHQATDILRDSAFNGQPFGDLIEQALAGKQELTAQIASAQVASPYHAKLIATPEQQGRWGLSHYSLLARQGAFESASKFGGVLRKMFFQKTSDLKTDEILRRMGPAMGETTRYHAAAAVDIGKKMRIMADELGLEDVDGVASIFGGIFEIMPQEADEFMVDSALNFIDDVADLPKFAEHVDNYISRIMHVVRTLDGVQKDPVSDAMLAAWKHLYPEMQSGANAATYSSFMTKVAEPLRFLRKELDVLPEMHEAHATYSATAKVAREGGLLERAAEYEGLAAREWENLQNVRARMEASVFDLKESMPALREELFQRGSRIFQHPEGKWFLQGEGVGSREALMRRAAKKGGKAVPLAAKAYNDVFETMVNLTSDNMRIASNLGFTSKASHPMAHVPRVLSARERTALDNILSSTEWDASQYQVYASGGSKNRKMDFVTTDTVEQVLWAMHKQGQVVGQSKTAKQAMDILNGGGEHYASSPIAAAITRNTEYKYFEDTGHMVDEILKEGGENFNAMMADKLPPGYASAIGGGRLVDLKRTTVQPLTKYVNGEPTTVGLDYWTAVIEKTGGGTVEIGFDDLEKVGMQVSFLGGGSTPGKAMMKNLSQGQGPRLLNSMDPDKVLQEIAGGNVQVMFGQGSTIKAIEKSAQKEMRSAYTLPQVLDGMHRLVKMGVTTGNAGFHMMNIASAVPLAQANGLTTGAMMRGAAAAISLIWRTPGMHSTNRQLAALFGETAVDGTLLAGFGDFALGATKVGAGVAAGYGVDKFFGEEGMGPGTALGTTLGAVAALSRGSGAALGRAIENRTLKETGEFVFHTADGSYTLRDTLLAGSRHGLINTFIESSTQALTAESKALSSILNDDFAGTTKLMAAVSEAGQQSELGSRLMIFFGFMHQGLNPEQAARKTAATLFDYADITPIEQHLFKRVSSFYTFGKKIMESTTKNYLKEPARIQRMAHLVWGYGDERYGEDQDTFLDTSFGRANLIVGGRAINVGRALPQLDVVNAIGYAMELASFGSGVVAGINKNSVGAETMRSLKLRREGITLAPEIPGILSGNVALQGRPPRDQETGIGLFDAINAASRNMILMRSIMELADSPERTGKTVYDEVEDVLFDAFGFSGKDALPARRRYLRSRADRIERELGTILRSELNPGAREEVKELLRKNRLRRQTLGLFQ